MRKISKKEQDTKALAEYLLSKIMDRKSKKATVVGLYGDLGTGKTTFTKFFGRLMGVKSKINSPTFVIMKRYRLKNNNFRNFFHIDAYRIKNGKELKNLFWEEIKDNPENLIFIEWPERIKKIIPKKHHKIYIKHTKKGEREFKVMPYK